MRAAGAAAAASPSLPSTCPEPSPTTAGAVLDPGRYEDLEPDLWQERANFVSPTAQIAGILAEQHQLAEEQEKMDRMVARLKDLLASTKFAGC